MGRFGSQQKDGNGIEQSLLAYLQTRPHAADTFDGIVAWWLPLQRRLDARANIEAALRNLIQLEVLRCNRLPDGTELYALDADSLASSQSH